MHRLTPVARKLRRKPTSAQRRLCRVLRGGKLENFRFRRQVTPSGCVVDFARLEARMTVEADGPAHSTEIEPRNDAERERRLKFFGFETLRFRNQDV